ncbi:YibE/F family protein [Candidatus Uhrbacteria bacterium]|nr:YibE/F family protein [Candidatus Uhrbacteria bacterium]
MRLSRLLCIIVLLLPLIAKAQDAPPSLIVSETFEARVIEIIRERAFTREDGSKVTQQDLRLRGLTGVWKGREALSQGISELDIIDAGVYKKGDRVIVYYDKVPDGKEIFTVTDYVRRPYLYLLAGFFILSIIAVGRRKGLRALLSLAMTFTVILGFIIPRILNGTNPVLVSVLGALAVVVLSIYITEGWNSRAHLATVSIAGALLLALGISVLFTYLTRLTGLTEESLYLMSLGKGAINFQGLLLAGMLIGTLGVLDDAVVSQIETVAQIREANPELSSRPVFKMAFKVGNSHLGAIVNTLFLTYAGASLPLLLLFKLNEEVAMTYGQVINSEIIAVEIVRTLAGSTAIALAFPIATFLAVYGERFARKRV